MLRENALIFGLVERPGSTKWRVRHPPFLYGENMRELSVFVDESGDFGEYDYHAPYYIISMVFHNQDLDISEGVQALERDLKNFRWTNHCVHVGPVIRSEEEYRGYELKDRQKILMKKMNFIRRLDVQFKSRYIDKKYIEDLIEAIGKLSKQLAVLIRDNYAFFCSSDSVKVYYDNGQVEVTRILSSVFNALLENVEFRRVLLADYRLFQVADLICTLKLAELKLENHLLSKSELYFFGDERTLKKNYLKSLAKKEL